MRRLVPVLLLLLSQPLMGVSGCLNSSCPAVPDGPLEAGVWGGSHWRFDVDSEGFVEVETDCAHGSSLAEVLTEGNAVSFEITMVGEGGPDAYQVDAAGTVPATVTGTLCDGTLTFTVTDSEGAISEGSVTHGSEGELFKCL